MNYLSRQSLIIVFLLGLGTVASSATAQNPKDSKSLFVAAKEMQKRLLELPEPNQGGWKRYFAWEKWGESLVQEQAPQEDALKEILPRFYGFYEGLDEPTFMRMRSEIKSYLEGTSPPAAIGRLPSLIIQVDKSVVDSALAKRARTQHRHQDTGNWIAGAWVTGTSDCTVDASANLVPYQNHAAIEVKLTGVVKSPHTIAHSGRFEVHGSAESQLQGVAYLIWDQGKLTATQPQVTTQTNSQVSHVNGPWPFRGIAMRQAQKRKAQGEAEGEAIVDSHVREEFSKELAAELQDVNEKVTQYQKHLEVLKRLDVAPSELTTAVVGNKLELGMRYTDSGSDKLPTALPADSNQQLGIVMHETFLSAFPRKFLKGVWWSSEEFEKLGKELSGSDPKEKLISTTSEWSARWDWNDPVVTRIAVDHILCELRFSHARIADQSTPGGIIVQAKFRPESNGGKILFRRISNVEVSARKEGETISAEAKAFFEGQFTAVCGEAIPLSSLSPPLSASISLMSFFTSSEVAIEEGWLHLDFKRTDEKWPSLLTKQYDKLSQIAK